MFNYRVKGKIKQLTRILAKQCLRLQCGNIRIFREINVEESRSAKSSILTHLKALNGDFCEFVHFNKADIFENNNV